MNYGFILPRGDARTAAQFARVAEQAGWDGFFVWEPVWGNDAWVMLAAAAMVTERIRLGTMLTPLSRMRPWKLASETVTLDHLSNGRVILAVGLGATDTGFAEFGEVTDRKTRAGLLDEGLEILTRLWQRSSFDFNGEHYHVHVDIERFQPPPPPPPVQQPRIPIWVVGAWPREKSMRRAVRYDGLLPAVMESNGKVRMGAPTPAELHAITHYCAENRPAGSYDIVLEGETPGADPQAAAVLVQSYRDAGATWWLESRWSESDLEKVMERVKQGPPKN